MNYGMRFHYSDDEIKIFRDPDCFEDFDGTINMKIRLNT